MTACFRPISEDTLLTTQYFKDITDFDLETFRTVKDGYFITKGKVYLWWGNSDGNYPVEVIGADPKTFIPFDSIAGGTDKKSVFYGGPPEDFSKIDGADPKTIKVLNPKRGCWNCGDCYFTDDKNVYYGLQKIKGADPKTFTLLNLDTIDAKDKNRKYFNGEPIE
ncbi:DKNYY domain-containing protein [Solitalea sp. MAHUQ-68]|uniref:DKNYY domain-containing protein n=1 Tax=Solitalea agri TaxID=2953739 RepID=A0A9X2F1C0_9SPHI|nr:DKNYY domain-containing protein [Solitalea agri]